MTETNTHVLAAPLWLLVANTSSSSVVRTVAGIAALSHAIAGLVAPLTGLRAVHRGRGSKQ
jgi:hypothetical protein